VVVDVSRRTRSRGELLGSALRLLAIYAGVRAALRARAAHNDEAGQKPHSIGRSKREPHDRVRSGPAEHRTAEALAEPDTSAVRASAGEARSSSPMSTTESSTSTRRHRSHRGGAGRTYRQLYEEARRRGVRGRSGMSKASLEEALSPSKTSTSGRP
jgi:hypothetical protein